MNSGNRPEKPRESLRRATFSRAWGPLVLMVCTLLLAAAWPALAQEGTENTTIGADQQLGMLQFIGDGQIRLELHDPAGNVVSRDTNEIEGATYTDEDEHVVIEIPHRMVGDYDLYVDADGSANRLHLFDVSVTDGVDAIQLAERVLIINVPTAPYVIRSSETGFANVTESAAGEPSSSDSSADEDNESSSSFPVWLIIVIAVVVGGIVGVLIVRFRKREP